MKRIFYAYVVIVLVISACSSGKSTFERGNYYEAVLTSVNRLRKNSDHKKSVETLRQAYPLAISFYEDRAKTAIASAEPFKWSQVVNAYTTINTMYDEIKRCPGALAVIPSPVNYASKLQEARTNAAEENYAAGIVALQFGERQKARQAYVLFKTANQFIPGYKDVISYMEAALNAATVKVLVEPIPVHAKAVGVSAEFFNDKISEFVHAAPINEFVRFYSRKEAETLNLQPDHIIQLQFDDFTVGQVYKHEKEIHLSKDSVVMGTYVSPSAAQQPQNTTDHNATSTRSGLVATTGTGVVVSQTPPKTSPAVNTESAAERAARESAEAEKQRLQQEDERQGALANRIKEEREAEQARAEREAAEKARLAEEQARREEAARQQAAQEAAKTAAEQEALERQAAEKAAREKAAMEAAAAEKAAAEKAEAERAKAEKEKAEKEKAEKEQAEKEKAKAEKEKADGQLAENKKAAADQADAMKEKAEKEKSEPAKNQKYIDPYIKRSDTLNVKDPVTICHTPPGNPEKRRTLVISRAALKAHLDHGDIQGDCNSKTKDNKEQQENGKGKPGEGEKASPEKGKGNGKGPGADRESIPPSANDGHALRLSANSVIVASADNDPLYWMRYAETAVAADTNKVYGTVKAILYHNRKTTTAKGVVSFRIIDAKTGGVLNSEKMPGEYVWVSEWARFNGDERALSPDQLKLTRLKEQPAPAPQDLFIEFTRPIYNQITEKISAFYKGY